MGIGRALALVSACAVVAGFGNVAMAGSVLVSARGSDAIFRYDATTGGLIGTFASGNGLNQPQEIVKGPDGHVYVANEGGDSVLKFDGTSGAFLGAFVAAGSGGLSNPVGMAFGPDGNLYVASGDDGILRYNGTTGAFIDVFVSDVDNVIHTGGQLRFGPDGHLYLSDGLSGQSAIKRFHGTTGEPLGISGVSGDAVFAANAVLENPGGFTFLDGYLYVVGFDSTNIVRFNATTGALVDEFASGGLLDSPTDIEVGLDGAFYVANFVYSGGPDTILSFDSTTGAPGGIFASGGAQDVPGFYSPVALLFVDDPSAPPPVIPLPAAVMVAPVGLGLAALARARRMRRG